jgi:hypothetical protein
MAGAFDWNCQGFALKFARGGRERWLDVGAAMAWWWLDDGNGSARVSRDSCHVSVAQNSSANRRQNLAKKYDSRRWRDGGEFGLSVGSRLCSLAVKPQKVAMTSFLMNFWWIFCYIFGDRSRTFVNFFWTLEIFFIGREFLKFSFCRRGILKFGGSYFLLVASYFLLVVFTFC